MYNKIRDTLAATVAHVGGSLPINIPKPISATLGSTPLSSEYEIGKQVGSAGPHCIWRIYDAVKRTTRQESAVWLLDKRILDKLLPNKSDRDAAIELLKRGVSQLTRLRHPRILGVLHALDESRDYLSFATEAVQYSLANALGSRTNFSPSPSEASSPQSTGGDVQQPNSNVTAQPPDSPSRSSAIRPPNEIEIKSGIVQVLEGLSFLHNDARIIHRNLTPENIVLNRNGCWKLFGFEHCFSLKSEANTGQVADYAEAEWAQQTPLLLPTLFFLAPDAFPTLATVSATRSSSSSGSKWSPASDMFSLGLVVLTVFGSGRLPFADCQTEFSLYKKNIEAMRRLNVQSIALREVPDALRSSVAQMLAIDASLRPEATQLSKLPYFEDLALSALHALDGIAQYDNLARSNFYKNLPQIVSRLPKEVVVGRVLPVMLSEFANPQMIPFVLPTVFLVIDQQLTDAEYLKLVFPALSQVMRLDQPVLIPLLILQNMALLLKKTPPAESKTHLLGVVSRALSLECHSDQTGLSVSAIQLHVQLQELCLQSLPAFLPVLDPVHLKSTLFPRIRTLLLAPSSSLSVRVQGLVCLGQMLELLDRWFVLDEVLPALREIPAASRSEPAVLMAILGVHQVALEHRKLGIPKDALASKVLPFLVPLAVENALNVQQFGLYMKVIRRMFDRLEEEQKSKLEQLQQIQVGAKALPLINSGLTPQDTNMDNSSQPNLMQRFLSEFRFSSSSASGVPTPSQSAAAAPIPNGVSAPSLQPQPLSASTGTSGPKDLSASLPPPIRPPPAAQPALSLQISAMLTASPATGAQSMAIMPTPLQQMQQKALLTPQAPLVPNAASSASSSLAGATQLAPTLSLNQTPNLNSFAAAFSGIGSSSQSAAQLSGALGIMSLQPPLQQSPIAASQTAAANSKQDLSALDSINAFNLMGTSGNKQPMLSTGATLNSMRAPASQPDLSEFDAFQKSRAQQSPSPAAARQSGQLAAPTIAALQPQPQTILQPQPAKMSVGPTLQPISDIASRLAASRAQPLQPQRAANAANNAAGVQKAQKAASGSAVDDLFFS